MQYVLPIVPDIEHVRPVIVLNVAVMVILVDAIRHNVTHRVHVLAIQVYAHLMDLLVLAIQVSVTLMVHVLVTHHNVHVTDMRVPAILDNATVTVLVVLVIVANAAVMDMHVLVIQDNVIVTIIVNVIRDIAQMIVPQMVFINFNDYEYNTIFEPRSNGIFRRTLEKS